MIRNPFPIIIVLSVSLSLLALRSKEKGNLEESIKRGAAVYKKQCITCHMENGEGIPGAFPPLAKSDFLVKNDEDVIKALLFGRSGEVTVNGEDYFGEMPPSNLTDDEIADVLNYVRNTWGNEGSEVTSEQVKKLRNYKKE